MLTVVALPTLAQSLNGDAPETSPTPAPDEICEAVVEGGEIVEGIEYGTEVIECNSITEDIITPASILPSFREPYAGSPVSGNTPSRNVGEQLIFVPRSLSKSSF
jgi:hypothetical protein